MEIVYFIINKFPKQWSRKQHPRESDRKVPEVWEIIMQTRLGAVFWACDVTIRSPLYQHDSRPFPEIYPELCYMNWCHIVCCITWRWMPKIIHFMCSMYLLVFTPTENKDGVLKLSVQSTSIFQNCKHSCTFLPLNHLLDDFFPEETDIREIVQICM